MNAVCSNQCVDEGHALIRRLLLSPGNRINRAASCSALYNAFIKRVIKVRSLF